MNSWFWEWRSRWRGGLFAGANACAFRADCAEGDPRTEVTFFAHGCAVTLSREVMWVRGGFGDAMAFDGRSAVGDAVPATFDPSG